MSKPYQNEVFHSMVNEKTISFRIEPYVKEATLQAGIDIIIMVLAATVLSVIKFPLSICISIVTGYFAIALILHYRVVIQAIIDKRKGDYITETVSIKKFIDEYSFAGDSLGHSYIHFFYPKEMQVWKYKIKVISNHGEEKKLRSVMSCRRLIEFAVLDKQQIKHLQVTYLKRSKILIRVDLAEEIDKNTSRKKTPVTKKAIHFINMSI